MVKEKDKKPLTLRKMVEEVIEFERGLVIENINIDGKEYKLKISNYDGKLVFNFNDRDYEIVINEKGVGFERCTYRPNHDHNDFESLQEGIDESVIGVKKGELTWRMRFPYRGEGYKHFQVPFGARTVSW